MQVFGGNQNFGVNTVWGKTKFWCGPKVKAEYEKISAIYQSWITDN